MTTAEPVTHRLTSNAHASASDNYEADLARMKEDLTNMLKAKLGLDILIVLIWYLTLLVGVFPIS